MTDLATAMEVARSTVAQRVTNLVAHGLVVTTADGAPRRGRPAAILRFNPSAGVVLAAQLGVTGARVAVTDLDGTILAREALEYTIDAGPESVLREIGDTFAGLLRTVHQSSTKVMGVGIALPSMVELSTAARAAASVDGWDSYPVEGYFNARFGAPTLVDHDVYLMALAEQRYRWPDAEVFCCLKVGTNIGCGVVADGRLVRGAQGMAGEIGHTRVVSEEVPCWCGNVGCLDAVAGGGALARELVRLGHNCTSAREVALLALSGVPDATQAVRRAGRYIGTVLAGVVNLMNPDIIALWGYLADADDLLFAGIRETIYQLSLPASTKRLQLVRAGLGGDAGTTGAAMMVVEHIFSDASVSELLSSS